jgi:uroporphyrinogen decarboxylase
LVYEVDEEGGYTFLERRVRNEESLKNIHEAGAQLLSDVEAVLSVKIGPGAEKNLRSQGILGLAVSGNIAKALTAYGKRGKFVRSSLFKNDLGHQFGGEAGCGGWLNMKPREFALAALNKAPHKRLTVSLLSGGLWTFRQKGYELKSMLENPALAAKTIVELSEIVKSDIVWPGSGYHNILVQIFGGKVKFRPGGNIDVIEPAFNSAADFHGINPRDLNKHSWIINLREMISLVNKSIGKQNLIGTSSWGPFTLAGQFYGVEKLMAGLYKDKKTVHELLEIMTEVCYEYLAPAIDSGAAILSIAEPSASGDLISLAHFEEFVAPYLTKLITRLKARGAWITLHICGNITNRIPLVPDLGVDLLSVDYKVDLKQALQALKGRIALAGNVNPVLFKESSVDEVTRAAVSCIKAAGDNANYILMPGCDIPAGVPLDNVKAFFSAGLNYSGNT